MDNWYRFQAQERQQRFLREAEENRMANLAKAAKVAEKSERRPVRLRDQVVAWLGNRRTAPSTQPGTLSTSRS